MKEHKKYSPQELINVWQCPHHIIDDAYSISAISIDTRHIPLPQTTLFFALKGTNSHGNIYIEDAVNKGVKNIVTDDPSFIISDKANYFIVENTLIALQTLAQYHRSLFKDIPIIGITGSNGKTIVKEWLSQMLADRPHTKSPKSYNSQIGVALSVWELAEEDTCGIFEAGVSQKGEMIHLANIISPNIGIFTALSDAHDSGFASMEEKLFEKTTLFKDSEIIIFEEDNKDIAKTIRNTYGDKKLLSWGFSKESTWIVIKNILKYESYSTLEIIHDSIFYTIHVPFSDEASVYNVFSCISALLSLGEPMTKIITNLNELKNLPMRLEMKNGRNGSLLINDTYNADLHSFKIALEFLSQQAGVRDKVVILSDFQQIGIDTELFAQKISYLLELHGVSTLLGVGSSMPIIEKHLSPFILFHKENTTEDLLKYLNYWSCDKKVILIKGARKFNLELVFEKLSDQSHSTQLETDLKAVENNLKVFKSIISPTTGIIAVIKASAYGTGSEDLALLLENKKVAYLAVAFADEGVRLRGAGISLPIMILNPDINSMSTILDHKLEPEVYCLDQIYKILSHLKLYNQSLDIHLKIDSGMHRLGFDFQELVVLAKILKSNTQYIKVRTIFSHLTSSENSEHDKWTHHQIQEFLKAYDYLTKILDYSIPKHILNSAGIVRFPEYQWDYVRLGLGLYGIPVSTQLEGLERVHTLTSYIIQIKHVKANETIGYNKKGEIYKDTHIAVINIGYADGLMRIASLGRFSVSIHGQDYPIIGQICMDLTMVDIGNDIDKIQVGDSVTIFSKHKPIEELALACQTIPYEILSRISERVKRVYTRK